VQYTCKGKVWAYPGQGGWRFVTIPKEISRRIEAFAPGPRPAFGSVRVAVSIGKTTWRTSLFPDKRARGYLLPLKAEVRKRERIADGDIVDIRLEFDS
jgi:hypothetical protein